MSRTKDAKAAVPPVRCAIYTRKSTEEGLEQAFNSLDAQREGAEAFILSQRHEGWRCLADRYDDAATPAVRSTAPPWRGCCGRSRPARSTAWSYTRWTGYRGPCWTSPG